MKHLRKSLLVLTIISAGFLIFVATRYVDDVHSLVQQTGPQICSGIELSGGLLAGGGCGTFAQTLPWTTLGWLIFLSISTFDLLVLDLYELRKSTKKPHVAADAKNP